MNRLGRLGLVWLLAASTAGLAGCKEDEDPRTVKQTIGRSGGQISSHDGVLTLLILPGALDGEHEFSIAPSDTPPIIFGPAYRVKPDVPLSINAEVTYARELPNDPTGSAVAAIHREEFETGQGAWIKLPTTELDVLNDLITGTDTEVSLFYGLLQGGDISGTTSSTTVEPTSSEAEAEAEAEAESESETEVETDSNSGETDETGDPGPLSHAADIQPIWEANCLGAGCHDEGMTPPTLAVDAYPNIVDVASNASVPYVTTGDSALSYVVHKLDGTYGLPADQGGCGCAGSGGPMPLGRDKLDLETRTLIKRWIDEGAMP